MTAQRTQVNHPHRRLQRLFSSCECAGACCGCAAGCRARASVGLLLHRAGRSRVKPTVEVGDHVACMQGRRSGQQGKAAARPMRAHCCLQAPCQQPAAPLDAASAGTAQRRSNPRHSPLLHQQPPTLVVPDEAGACAGWHLLRVQRPPALQRPDVGDVDDRGGVQLEHPDGPHLRGVGWGGTRHRSRQASRMLSTQHAGIGGTATARSAPGQVLLAAAAGGAGDRAGAACSAPPPPPPGSAPARP